MSMHQRADLHTPVVIIGSGIAGLLTALKLAEAHVAVTVVTKTELTENSSRYAQGGIAAVLPNQTHDSLEAHVQDTLNAGAGLSNEAITRSILADAPYVIDDLLAFGVPFDRVNGQLAFTKEAAHTHARILHAGGDATGRSIQDMLTQHVKAHPLITVFEQCTALSLLTDTNNCCTGLRVAHTQHNDQGDMAQWHIQTIHAPYTVIATGGVGRLYRQTTNPIIATGDGVALAYEAGAIIQDMEFVQFHPTAFWAPDEADADTGKGSVRFLISEALRGEGAILRNAAGEAYAKTYHPDGELAPRDIVTRLIWSEMAKTNQPHSYLDITHLPAAHLEQRFPTILQSCLSFGIDIRKDWIPVAPAAHYAMGGVFVDANGQTSIPGLMAVGEVVCSQLHGANRLASNSLLECVVLARRVAKTVTSATHDTNATFTTEGTPTSPIQKAAATAEMEDWPLLIETLRSMMWQHAGIIRDEDGLLICRAFIRQAQAQLTAMVDGPDNPAWVSINQMFTTSALIVDAALARCESRGAHYRADTPALSARAQHSVQQRTVVTPPETRLQPV